MHSVHRLGLLGQITNDNIIARDWTGLDSLAKRS